jgi:hypothetical protein
MPTRNRAPRQRGWPSSQNRTSSHFPIQTQFNTKTSRPATMSSKLSSITTNLPLMQTPKSKRAAAFDCDWIPSPPKARRCLAYESCGKSSLLLPDLQGPDESRQSTLSYRPQMLDVCFEPTSPIKALHSFDACPPALPLSASDSSMSDSSLDQSDLSVEALTISFDEECDLEYDTPRIINLRPRFSFDEFDCSF